MPLGMRPSNKQQRTVREHQRATEMEQTEAWCKTCKVDFGYPSKLQRHLQTHKHKLRQSLDHMAHSVESAMEEETRHTGECIVEEMEMGESFMSDEEVEPVELECNLLSDEETDMPSSTEETDMPSSTEETDVPSSTEEMETVALANLFLQKGQAAANDYYPFTSKITALAFILLRSLHPVSERVVSFVLHICKHIDPNSPSLHQVKKYSLPGYTPPTKHYSSRQIPFFVNKPSTILRKCLGTPSTAKLLRRYPVLSDDYVGEMFEAKRWIEDSIFYSPMAIFNDNHVFVGDIVALTNSSNFGKIVKFMTDKPTGDMIVEVREIVRCSKKFKVGDILRVRSKEIGEPIQTLPFKREDLLNVTTEQEWATLTSVHHTKHLANNRPVVIVPLVLYSDDSSGNRSKKWNKFDNWALLLAGIPKAHNTDLHNIHFITCSNEVFCLDLIEGFIEDLVKLETEGVSVYDAHLQCEVLLIAPVIVVICDNPRASELTSHLGSSAKHYCRMCMSNKDTTAHKISAARSKEASLTQMGLISQARKPQVRELQTKYGLYGQANALFQLSCDLYKSTPIECLHTILLGAYKYLFKSLMMKITPEAKKIIAAKITAFPKSGRTSSLSGGITRYYQSCVGRDFKALAEMAPFILWEHLTDIERKIWVLLSEVFRAAYCENVSKDSIKHVRDVTKQLLDTVRTHQPDLLKKPKMHLLLHLPDDMESFGPTMAYNTERCETFNGVMRDFNLHTNRQSSSRDIAIRFAVMEQLQFLLRKGIAPDDTTVRIGNGLSDLLTSRQVQLYAFSAHPHVLNSTKAIYGHGALRKEQFKLVQLNDVKLNIPKGEGKLAQLRLEGFIFHMSMPLDTPVTTYQSICLNGALGSLGDSVAYRREGYDKVAYGRLATILQLPAGETAAVVLSYCERGETNAQGCKLIEATQHIKLIDPQDIIQTVSIVHNCNSKCILTRRSKRAIEREDVITDKYYSIEHDFTHNIYCVNKYCSSFI